MDSPLLKERGVKPLSLERLDRVTPYPGIIDSHIHLDSLAYADDLDVVVARARALGVTHMLLPSTDLESSRAIADFCRRDPQLFSGALGIHPHEASSYQVGATEADWKELLAAAPWRAVGETGLECHYDFCSLEVQFASLRAHLVLARETGLPLILHCREAESHLFDLLQAEGQGLHGVVHCFTGGWAWAQRFLDLGFHLGIGGLVTLPKADAIHEVAAQVPADRWLLETDGPYLAPVPFRGQRNESCLLPVVVERISELRGVPPEQLVLQARQNFTALFPPTA